MLIAVSVKWYPYFVGEGCTLLVENNFIYGDSPDAEESTPTILTVAGVIFVKGKYVLDLIVALQMME